MHNIDDIGCHQASSSSLMVSPTSTDTLDKANSKALHFIATRICSKSMLHPVYTCPPTIPSIISILPSLLWVCFEMFSLVFLHLMNFLGKQGSI